MQNVKKITPDLFWVGASDRRIARFENMYPVPRGVSYNAYLVLDEQAVLFDTIDQCMSAQFIENLKHLLGDKPLDYVVVQHMEPDHAATLEEVVLRYPTVKIVGNAKTFGMIKQFFDFDLTDRMVVVKEGDTLCTGRHTFQFVMAPMVHWPEVMVTYDTTDKTLFSADAFGSFGALSGNLFADEVDFDRDWIDDARRYFTNIVGKYGMQVQALLKKTSALEIERICPLHGVVWRENLSYYIEKHQLWSTYTPESQAVVIIYGSIYGNTENAATLLANKLGDAGVRDIRMYDVSGVHVSYLIAECFRCSHIVLAAATYNAGVFTPMDNLVRDLAAHGLQNRTFAVMDNGSWAPTAGKQLREMVGVMKKCTVLEESVSVKSALKDETAVDAMAQAIVASL